MDPSRERKVQACGCDAGEIGLKGWIGYAAVFDDAFNVLMDRWPVLVLSTSSKSASSRGFSSYDDKTSVGGGGRRDGVKISLAHVGER